MIFDLKIIKLYWNCAESQKNIFVGVYVDPYRTRGDAKARAVSADGGSRWGTLGAVGPLQKARRDRAGLEAMWQSLPTKENTPHPLPKRRIQWK